MKRINEIVVVEGKTDSQLLKELYDVDTIETHGLGLDEKTLELIKEASKTRGVIVLTDPDYPGLKIRNQVEKYVQNCKHAFVDRKDAIGRKKLGIAEANKKDYKKKENREEGFESKGKKGRKQKPTVEVQRPQPKPEVKKEEEIKQITIPEVLTIQELADKMKVVPSDRKETVHAGQDRNSESGN